MLKRKMLRDLKLLKGQFFAIFFMCFIGTFVYSGIYGEWKGMEVQADALYEESNLADGWIYGEFSNTDKLQQVKSVDAYEKRLMLPCQVKGENKHQLQLYAVDEGNIDQFVSVEGEPYSQSDGIWLDIAYAKANNYHVNDSITLTQDGVEITQVIKGLGYHPLYVFALKDNTSMLPDHETFGFAFVSKQANELLKQLPYNQISIDSTQTFETWKKDVEQVFPNQSIQMYQQSDHYSVSTTQSEIDQHRSIGTVLPIVFLIVAILSTLNTMQKVIMNQRVQIGTLKALGFQKHRLYLHYMSHVMVLCCLGCLTGTILGPCILPELIYTMQKTMYTLPVWQSHVDISVLFLCVGIILACLLACMRAISKTLKETSADLLRGNTKQKVHDIALQIPFTKPDSFFFIRWNLRDIFRNKARSFLALFGIMGCSGILLCSLGLVDSINAMIDLQYVSLHTYESKMELAQPIATSDLQRIKQRYDATGGFSTTITLQTIDKEESISLEVLENTNLLHLDEANSIELPENGILLSRKLANQYNIQEGDTITWKLPGDSKQYQGKVEQLVMTPLSQGIYTSVDFYESQGLIYQPSYLLSNAKSIEQDSAIKQVQYRENLLTSMETMMETMILIIGILIFAALLLGTIVLYNFTSLTFYERTREIATLKVLGFPNSKARKISRIQNELLCFVGILIGMPFGYGLLAFMTSTLSQVMDMLVVLNISSIAYSVVFTWGMMLLVTAIMNRHVKEIDMVAALKGTE